MEAVMCQTSAMAVERIDRVCAWCGQMWNVNGRWTSTRPVNEARSHGICTVCMARLVEGDSVLRERK